MSKLPKDFLKKIINAEYFEKFDIHEKRWVKVPVEAKHPGVQRLKEMMIAEIEINVIREAMELGLIFPNDRDYD